MGWLLVCVLLLALPGGGLAQDITNNIVSHWPMDAGSGTTANDAVGTNHLLFDSGLNAPSWLTTGCQLGAACLSFGAPPNGDRLVGFTLAIGSTYTLTGWVWIQPGLTESYILLWGHPTSGNGLWYRGSAAGADAGKLTWYMEADHHSTVTVPTGTWVHIAVVGAAPTVTFYINGSASGTFTPALSDNMGVFGVTGTDAYQGRLDQWFWYSRALTAADIAARIAADTPAAAVTTRRRVLQY